MRIVAGCEASEKDLRVPLTPAAVKKLVEMGASVGIEVGLGKFIGESDAAYQAAGAEIVADRKSLNGSADMVLRLRRPATADLDGIKPGTVLVSFLDPFNERPLLAELARRGITALCMELIPRSTIAQKMDALSSQANLAGYVAVLLAAESLDKIFPMMSTPSGTISPARVFIIGAGVAGLQAIATAKRLGAIVEAFDTRPVVEEQVKSLGGRFVKIDLGETGQTKDGYAKALTEEQLAIQREAMARHCEKSDVVISTAQVFGRKAPLIVTEEMVARMRPGSVIVDLAVESGGNVAGSEPGRIVEKNGVRIIGLTPLPSRVARDASQMYSNNLVGLVGHFWDKKEKTFLLKVEDEILKSCMVTHEGAICHPLFQ